MPEQRWYPLFNVIAGGLVLGVRSHVYESFWLRLPIDDPRTQAVLQVFDDFGWKPWDDHRRPRGENEYWVRYWRQYSTRDLASAELLQPIPSVFNEGARRTDEGTLVLNRRELRKKADIARAEFEWIIVSDRLRKLLEASDLRHVVLRPTLVAESDRDDAQLIKWEKVGDPYWELTSDVILPRLSPSVDLRDHKTGQPHDLDDSRAYRLIEGLFTDPELHYQRSDLKLPPEFDVAVTYERFRSTLKERRLRVVSQRFYQFCREHKIRSKWVPVRIDD